MSRNEIKMLFRQLPFENFTDYDLENDFKSAKARIQQQMNYHRLENFLTENYLMELFNPFVLNVCKYSHALSTKKKKKCLPGISCRECV